MLETFLWLIAGLRKGERGLRSGVLCCELPIGKAPMCCCEFVLSCPAECCPLLVGADCCWLGNCLLRRGARKVRTAADGCDCKPPLPMLEGMFVNVAAGFVKLLRKLVACIGLAALGGSLSPRVPSKDVDISEVILR